MIIKEKFLLIGFTDFISLNKEMRDGKERITFSSKYLEVPILLLLVNENDVWEIEKIEDDDIISYTLKKNKTSLGVEDLLLFFKNHYYRNSEISTFL